MPLESSPKNNDIPRSSPRRETIVDRTTVQDFQMLKGQGKEVSALASNLAEKFLIQEFKGTPRDLFRSPEARLGFEALVYNYATISNEALALLKKYVSEYVKELPFEQGKAESAKILHDGFKMTAVTKGALAFAIDGTDIVISHEKTYWTYRMAKETPLRPGETSEKVDVFGWSVELIRDSKGEKAAIVIEWKSGSPLRFDRLPGSPETSMHKSFSTIYESQDKSTRLFYLEPKPEWVRNTKMIPEVRLDSNPYRKP